MTQNNESIDSFTINDLSGVFDDRELVDASFSASELKSADISASLLRESGHYSIQDLLDASYSSTEIIDASFTFNDIQRPEYSYITFRNLTDTIGNYLFKPTQLNAGLPNGLSIQDLSLNNVIPSDGVVFNTDTHLYRRIDILDASFTIPALMTIFQGDLSFSIKELVDSGYSLDDIFRGYVPTLKLEDVWIGQVFPISEYHTTLLINDNYGQPITTTVNDLHYYNPELTIGDVSGIYDLSSIIQGGFNVSELFTNHISLTDVVLYRTSNMNTNDYDYMASHFAGIYDISNILQAGFPLNELKDISDITIGMLSELNFTLLDYYTNNFADDDIIYVAYNRPLNEVYSIYVLDKNNLLFGPQNIYDLSMATLEEIYDSSYGLNEIVKSNYFSLYQIVQDLSGRQVDFKMIYDIVYYTNDTSYNINDFKTITDISNIIADLSFSVTELRDSSISGELLREFGEYTITDLSNGGYDISSIIQSGFSTQSLYNANITVDVIYKYGRENYTAKQLLEDTSFTYVADDIIPNWRNIEQLEDVFEITDIDDHYIPSDLLGVFHISNIINDTSYITQDFYDASFSVNILGEYGYQFSSLVDTSYTESQLLNKNDVTSYSLQTKHTFFDVSFLHIYGLYTPRELLDASFIDILSVIQYGEYSTADFYNSGISVVLLQKNNYPITEFVDSSYSLSDIFNGNYSVIDLSSASYTARELSVYSDNFLPQDLSGIYDDYDIIIDSSYTLSQLIDSSFSLDRIQDKNNDTDGTKTLRFSVIEYKDLSFTTQDLCGVGFSISDLSDIYPRTGKDTNTIVKAGYSVIDLSNANFKISELVTGFSLLELKNAGFSDTDLANEILNIDVTTLKPAGISVVTIKNVDVSNIILKELLSLSGVNAFTVSDLGIVDGYTANDFFSLSGDVSLNDLITTFDYNTLSDAGYILSNFAENNVDISYLYTSYNDLPFNRESTFIPTIVSLINAGFSFDTMYPFFSYSVILEPFMPKTILENNFDVLQDISTATIDNIILIYSQLNSGGLDLNIEMTSVQFKLLRVGGKILNDLDIKISAELVNVFKTYTFKLVDGLEIGDEVAKLYEVGGYDKLDVDILSNQEISSDDLLGRGASICEINSKFGLDTEIKRTWERFEFSELKNSYTHEDLVENAMRRKAEVLKHSENTYKNTKKQNIVNSLKGSTKTCLRQTFATSSSISGANSNVLNLNRVGNTLIYPSLSIETFSLYPSSASNVPGQMQLYLDPSKPLVRYNKRYSFPNDS
jgi:hypothetical protein